MCKPVVPNVPLKVATRSYVRSTAAERAVGFVAASCFTVTYYLSPLYLLGSLSFVVLSSAPAQTKAMVMSPMVASLAMPASFLPKVGFAVLTSWPLRQMLKYFAFEEYLEVTDEEISKLTAEGKRFIFCFHPHGIFPFSAACSLVSALGATDDEGRVSRYPEPSKIIESFPTAVATVLLHLPVLKDVVGMFGCIDASAAVLSKRLATRSCALYVGGMLELFYASSASEAVVIKRRKGFVKLALRTGADLIPVFQFGNTTVLSALTSGPLAAISRKLGVSVTVFWGRWGLPLPRPVKLTYVRGRPLGLPQIKDPTDADVDHWHAVYCANLEVLYTHYRQFNPDYKAKALIMH